MKQLLVCATLALSVAAFAAEPKDGSRKMGPRGGMEGPSDPVVRLVTNPRMAEKIGLSDEQCKQIREIGKESRKDGDALRMKLGEAMKRQTELLSADKIDEAAVMAEIDKAYDIRKEMAKRQTRRIIQIKSILTPEQVEKALAEVKARQNRDKGKPEPDAKAKEKDGRPEGEKTCAASEQKAGEEKCEKKLDGSDKPRKRQKKQKQTEE